MLKFYQGNPGFPLSKIVIGGMCPHCKTGTRFMRTTDPNDRFYEERIEHIVINYSCEICLEPIPVQWYVSAMAGDPAVKYPIIVTPAVEEFDFEYIPIDVKNEIQDALNCLSVNSYNGFAAISRRAIQAICTDLGANSSTKIKKQILDMAKENNLEQDVVDTAIQVMLSGHDGSHPHLPEVDSSRAELLLALMQDLTYQIYTRPGKLRKTAEARIEAIKKQSEEKSDIDPE